MTHEEAARLGSPFEVTACLSNAPWPTAEAYVSRPEPGHPGFRIVGYRVPTENPEMVKSIFDLSERDRLFGEMQRRRVRGIVGVLGSAFLLGVAAGAAGIRWWYGV